MTDAFSTYVEGTVIAHRENRFQVEGYPHWYLVKGELPPIGRHVFAIVNGRHQVQGIKVRGPLAQRIVDSHAHGR